MAFIDSLKYRIKQAALTAGIGLAALTGQGKSDAPEESTIDAFTPDRVEALARMLGYELENTLNPEGGLPLTDKTAVWPDPNDPNTMYEMDTAGNPISKIEFKPDANGDIQAVRQNMRNGGSYDGPVVGSDPRGPNITDYTDSDEYNDADRGTNTSRKSQKTQAPARRKSKMSFFSNVGGPHRTDYYYDDNEKLTPHNPDEPDQSQTEQSTPSNRANNAASDSPAVGPDGYDAGYDAATPDMTGATNAPAAPQQPYYSDQDVLNMLYWQRYMQGEDTSVSVSPQEETELQNYYGKAGLSLDDITKQGGIPISDRTYMVRDENDPTKFHEYNRFTNALEGTGTIRGQNGKINFELRDNSGTMSRTIDTSDYSSESSKTIGGVVYKKDWDNNGNVSALTTYDPNDPTSATYTTYKDNPDGTFETQTAETDHFGNAIHISQYQAQDGTTRKEVRKNGELTCVKFAHDPNLIDVKDVYIRDKDNPELWVKVGETGKDGKPVYYRINQAGGISFSPLTQEAEQEKAHPVSTTHTTSSLKDMLKSHSMPAKPNFVPGMDGSSRTNRVDRVNVAAPAGSKTTFVPTPALLKALGDKKQK